MTERSYSIYLWHFPLILAVYERGPFKRAAPEDGYWWRIPLVWLLTMVFATVSYNCVERPGMEYGRRLAKKISARRGSRRMTKETAS